MFKAISSMPSLTVAIRNRHSLPTTRRANSEEYLLEVTSHPYYEIVIQYLQIFVKIGEVPFYNRYYIF